MTKNIAVVDEQGNQYEATYPKRAKGLVKNGRARFVDENTICLACPPNMELEDKEMSEYTMDSANNVPAENGHGKVMEAVANLLNVKAEQQSSDKLTMGYVLGKIEEISTDRSYITAAISELGKMKSGGPGDIGTEEQAKAIGDIVKARETTNQKLIALYEKMYDDLKPEKVNNEKVVILDRLIGTLGEGITPVESKEALIEILTYVLQDT
jgi:hypothetical protein